MQLQQPFGSLLKKYRKKLDFTQEQLAEKVGCSVETLRKIEAGNRPSVQLASRLAQALKVPEEEQAAFIRIARNLPPEHEPIRPDLPVAARPVASLLGFNQKFVILPREALLTKDVYVLGRDSSCDIVVQGYGEKRDGEKINVVSRRHAKIERDGPRFLIHDTVSLNGTYVNGQKLEGPHLLAHDDKIGLGLPEEMLIFFDPDPTSRVE
ncbi:MAG: FHA domain-containing protein [Kouleothrix sp.]